MHLHSSPIPCPSSAFESCSLTALALAWCHWVDPIPVARTISITF
jgi:hypothetical protein